MRVSLALVLLLRAASVGAQQPSLSAICARVIGELRPRFGPTPTAPIYAAGERCVPEWIVWLQSNNPEHVDRARNALVVIGGRAAVDALRAETERNPTASAIDATVTAMATTGSDADIAYVTAHLAAPTAWDGNRAAMTLGFLRAVSAREALRAALAKTKPNSADQRSIEHALSALDKPACADSGVAAPKDLIRIIVRCQPFAMWTGFRYVDTGARGVWAFSDSAWQLVPGVPHYTIGKPSVGFSASIAPDGVHGEVTLGTFCGSLCGEGWTYRLRRDGVVWRVVGAFMDWES